MPTDISTDKTGFQGLSYTLTALPVLPFLVLDGFTEEGVTWDDIEPATVKVGADGLTAVVQKPVTYQGTFSLMANSAARNALDAFIAATTPAFGKGLLDYELILTETNEMTGMKTVYSKGAITSANGGNTANMNDGQGAKTYRMTFGNRIMSPI